MDRRLALVHIDEESMGSYLLETMGVEFLKTLRETPGLTVVEIRTIESLKKEIAENNPKVLLLADETLSKGKFIPLINSILKPFIRDGGIVICGFVMATLTRPKDFDRMMELLGLPWKYGVYNRTTFEITTVGSSKLNNVPQLSNVKAVQLSQVPNSQRLYGPQIGGFTQSLVFPPQETDSYNAMCAFARIGQGGFGFIGDVNAEASTNTITAAMCLIDI